VKRLFFFCAMLTPLGACLGITVDVGTTPRDAGLDTRAREEERGAPLVPSADSGDAPVDADDPLHACGASGRIDRVGTAKELVDRLIGSWAQCGGPPTSPLPCAPPAKFWGIRFSRYSRFEGRFVLLGTDDLGSEYVEQPPPCGRGAFKIWAGSFGDGAVPQLVDGAVPDDDAGHVMQPSQYVPLDDTDFRNGLQLHLVLENGFEDYEDIDFEKDPERLYLAEIGNIRSGSYFARLKPREK
jgi:hypothetical protein